MQIEILDDNHAHIDKSEFSTPTRTDILCKLYEIETLINDAKTYKMFTGKYTTPLYLLKIHMERKKADILKVINYCKKHLQLYPEFLEEIRQLTIQTNQI